jgi:hypothetical protein
VEKQLKSKKMDMRFVTSNIRSMYKLSSLKTVAEEISKCKTFLVAVQEARWDRGGTEPADGYTTYILLWKGKSE